MPARTVVISGGGTGMGKAVAASFARSGDDVIIMGRRADVLRDAVRDLESQTSRPVRWRACDVSDPAQLDRLVDWLATEGIATVDVLVNNAGGPASGLPEKTLADVAALWEADFRGNVLTAVLPTSALLSRRPDRDRILHCCPSGRRWLLRRGQGSAHPLDLQSGDRAGSGRDHRQYRGAGLRRRHGILW